MHDWWALHSFSTMWVNKTKRTFAYIKLIFLAFVFPLAYSSLPFRVTPLI